MFTKPRAFTKDDIFINPGRVDRFDYNWGFIQLYKWYNDENTERIKKLILIFPKEELSLNTLARRIKYFHALKKELEFFSERYDWNNFTGMYDVYISRFEHLICQIAEAVMYSVQFYTRNKKGYSGPEIKYFEDIGKFFVDEHSGLPDYYTKSINDSALLSILLFIRNSVVHDHRNIRYEQNKQDPIVESDNIPPEKRYGILRWLYLDHLLKFYKGKKTPSGIIKIKDPRFYLDVKLKLTRNCKVNHDETILSFSTDILELINRLADKEFFGLFRDVFNVLLNENEK